MRLLLCAGALLATMALAGCGESHSWHQKVTVEVDTPEGLKSASSVMIMKADALSRWERGMTGRAYRFDLQGEAVALEVAPGRYLFALTPRALDLAFSALHKRFGLQIADYEPLILNIASFRGTVTLAPKDYPMLVTFGDIADPKTVRAVNPDDLAAAFGPGVSLKAITLKITDEPVTEGRVKGLLTWLGPYPEPALGPATGRTSDIPFYRELSQGDFLKRPIDRDKRDP